MVTQDRGPTILPVAAEEPPAPIPVKRPGALESLFRALTSWRTASVTLLSFASGLPLGLVWIAIPDWMRRIGVDIRVVGLITLAQAPWTFKFLWSPLMDRYVPPWLGRRRGWAAIAQVALFARTWPRRGRAATPTRPGSSARWRSPSPSPAPPRTSPIDAYAVDVLRPDEQAVAVGARNAVYRSGYSSPAASPSPSPALGVAGRQRRPRAALPADAAGHWKAPEPHERGSGAAHAARGGLVPLPGLPLPPPGARDPRLRASLQARRQPRPGAAAAVPGRHGLQRLRPRRGAGAIGLVGNIVGTFVGGLLTEALGLGRALWIFGFLQLFSNVGYVLLAHRAASNRPLMYGAIGFEMFASGLGSGAFSVLLLRMTQKRFSATQYALFSSLFGLPRIVSGPICGFLVDAVGWETFFWSTLAVRHPGHADARPLRALGGKDPVFTVEPPGERAPLQPGDLLRRGLLGGVIGTCFGFLISALLTALRILKDEPEKSFDLVGPLRALVAPHDPGGWITLIGLLAFGAVCGLFTAAITAARRGAGRELAEG